MSKHALKKKEPVSVVHKSFAAIILNNFYKIDYI